MAWDNLPPVSGVTDIHWYDFITQYWRAVRERTAITSDTTHWPPSTFVWQTGTVSGIRDLGGGQLALYDAASGVSWVDGLSVKRWTSFGGTFNGNDLSPYAPSTYRVAIYPSDSTPLGLCDPNLGSVHVISDNGNNYVVFNNDGLLTVNGKVLADYSSGWSYDIIRYGVSEPSQYGYSWIQRYPPKPNNTELDYGTISSGTSSTLYDTRTTGFQTPKNWNGQYNGKDVVFSVSGVWTRASITGSSGNKLTFTSQSYIPDGQYWITETLPSGWFRPAYALSLTQVQTRSGLVWVRDANYPWCPVGWYNSLIAEDNQSHSPADDTVVGYGGVFSQSVSKELSGSEIAPCEETTIDVFDTDAKTDVIDYCGNEDHRFNPYMYYSLRGFQTGVEDLFAGAAWVEPKDYDGKKAIDQFTYATWWRYHTPANTVTATVQSIPSGGSWLNLTNISPSGLPEITPFAGRYTQLPCYFTTISGTLSDGVVVRDGTGTYDNSQRLTWDSDNFTDTDVGDHINVVIAYDWTRRYPRTFRYLYPRTVFIPEVDPGVKVPPTSGYPGEWQTTDKSTTYCEYTKYGQLEDATAFVTGESARYVADNFDDPFNVPPTGNALSSWYDAAYQGRPNTGTGFPRWEGTNRSGTATSGGSYWLEDTGQLWWVSATPLVTHTGSGTSGGSTNQLKDSTKTGNGFWTSMLGQRFVGMIAEVQTSSGVWERSPITSQTGTTLNVANAFTSTTVGKQYQIREAGYDGSRAIANTWTDRQLRVYHAGSSSGTITQITHSDDTRLYFADNSLGFSVAAGDRYEIIQLDPGAVLQWGSGTNPNNINGWLLPEDATQDTRGSSWHTGSNGPYENLPTCVNNYGRLRKADYVAMHVHTELYNAIDALRWIKKGFSWSSRSPANYLSDTEEDNDQRCVISFLSGPNHDSAFSLASRMPTKLGIPGTYPSTDPGVLEDGFTSTVTESDSTPPKCEWGVYVGGPYELERVYSYGVLTPATTKLASQDSLYVVADEIETNDTDKLFSDCGTSLTFGRFKKYIDIATSLNSNRRTTEGFGQTATVPALEHPPFNPPISGDNGSGPNMVGYIVTRWTAIEKYDVASGLVYVSL